jgi:hypothetical protein
VSAQTTKVLELPEFKGIYVTTASLSQASEQAGGNRKAQRKYLL